MFLIADSGSTKTDWVLVQQSGGVEGRVAFKTHGINPVLMDQADIEALLRLELLPHLDGRLPAALYFYGAGCREEQIPKMQAAFSAVVPRAGSIGERMFSFHSDLLGAARALCGREEGLACILGTGANACYYDGEKTVSNRPALGYVLGDEGSGAVLGRLLVNGLYEGLLPASLRETFEREMQLSLPIIINNVYREPMANRFLASLSPFVRAHLCEEPLRRMVVDNFRQFVRRSILPYGRKDLPVNAVGSIAFHYAPLLTEAVEAEGCRMGRIIQSPIDRLVEYHLQS